MKRMNPLSTDNNPAPIPGCHAPVKGIAHSAVVSRLHLAAHGFPCVMTTEVTSSRDLSFLLCHVDLDYMISFF
jgi:hypothetical protein